jgi:ankyrin repeat protein
MDTVEPDVKEGEKRMARSMVFGIILLFAIMAGCNGKPEAVKAREKLELSGFAFDADEFVSRAKEGDCNNVHLFLKAGMNPDAKDSNGQTALMLAASNGRAEVVERLIDRGADMEKKTEKGNTPLILASN